VGEDALGDGAGASSRGHHHRDAAGGGRVQVDQVRPDAGPGEHPHPRRPVEERGVDHGVGAHDRALGDRQVVLGGFGDEVDVIAEHAGDQVGLDPAEADHHRAGHDAATRGSPP